MGPGSLVTGHTVLDWIEARGAVTGNRFLVPRDLVWLGQRTCGDWRIAMISGTSNGLAAGNTRAEAVAHACYELAERDAGAALAATPGGDSGASWTWARCRAAGAPNWRPGSRLPGRGWRWQPPRVAFSLPGFAAYLWAEDSAAMLAAGAGTHARSGDRAVPGDHRGGAIPPDGHRRGPGRHQRPPVTAGGNTGRAARPRGPGGKLGRAHRRARLVLPHR